MNFLKVLDLKKLRRFWMPLLMLLSLVAITSCSHFSTSATKEKFVLAETDGNMTVEFIDNCGANSEVEKKSFVFFNQSVNQIKGWSHVSKPENAAIYASVKHTPKDPRYYIPFEAAGETVSTATVKSDPSCSNQKAYEASFVRKYNGTGSRHLNGIEPRFEAANISFDQLDAIVIEMKIDTQASNIYNQQELMDKLKISPTAANAVDSGDAALWLWAFTGGNYKANKVGKSFRLNLAKYGDRWIRVTIKNDTQFKDKISQVNLYQILWGDSLDTNADSSEPTLFKELDVHIKNYYLRLK